jgi:AcrR family transcriptional regulator
MNWQRGERQTERTKKALEEAFRQLLQEKSYEALTVDEIITRANTGRSTFYRHFQSKADMLLSLHQALFQRISLNLDSAADWLGPEPSAALIGWLEGLQQYGEPSPAAFFRLGKDTDYLVRRINELLVTQLEASLRHAFREEESTIPLAVLARSVAGSYSWIIQWWLLEERTIPAPTLARYVHRLVRATVSEAMQSS